MAYAFIGQCDIWGVQRESEPDTPELLKVNYEDYKQVLEGKIRVKNVIIGNLSA